MQTISQLFEKSRAAEFGFSVQELRELLDEEKKADPQHLDELVLAQACARGNEKAWLLFVRVYRPKLYAAAVAITRDEYAGRELADSLYGELFGTELNGDGVRKSKFVYYSGRGSLDGWLRTLLAQEHVNRVRREQKLISFEDAVSVAAIDGTSGGDQRVLIAATDVALAELRDEERFLLAAYYLDQRTLAEIGRMLMMHESSVSRRLDKVIRRLRKRILTGLRERGLSKQEAEEMLRSDVREMEIDLGERLMQGRQA